MALRRPPFEPRASSCYLFHQYLDGYIEWRKFIPGWEQEKAGSPAPRSLQQLAQAGLVRGRRHRDQLVADGEAGLGSREER